MIMSVMNLIVTGGEFMLKAIFFDLDDTLLWDEKSIQISLEETCDYAETSYNISAENLLRMVRKIAPQLYAEYDTYRSEEHTSELQSRFDLVCRLLLEKKKK